MKDSALVKDAVFYPGGELVQRYDICSVPTEQTGDLCNNAGLVRTADVQAGDVCWFGRGSVAVGQDSV